MLAGILSDESNDFENVLVMAKENNGDYRLWVFDANKEFISVSAIKLHDLAVDAIANRIERSE